MNSLVVQELEQNRGHHLELTLMAGRNGLKKKITHSQVQKMGLALTGFIQFIDPERLQIIGNTEIAYFKTLTPEMQEKVIHQICNLPLSSWMSMGWASSSWAKVGSGRVNAPWI